MKNVSKTSGGVGVADRLRAGFTLMEINLVLLLFSVAITGLLGIMPVGLKQGNLALSDTICETFAENVLGQIQGNAAEMTDWKDWESEARFRDEVMKGVRVDGNQIDCGGDEELSSNGMYLDMPRINLGYRLEITRVKHPVDFGGRLYRASIWVTDSKGGKPYDRTPFVVDMAYTGVAP